MDWHEHWVQALGRVSDKDVRVDLKHFHARVNMLIIRHLLLGSPILILFILPVLFWLLLHSRFHSFKQICADTGKNVVSKLFDMTRIENEAASMAA
jgi:hypothetical protein